MIPFHRIAGQIYNRPLLVTEDAARTVSSYFLSRVGAKGGMVADNERSIETVQVFSPTPGPGGSSVYHSPRASRFVGQYDTGMDGRPAPYRRTDSGAAIITVIGELVNRGAWIGASSGLVSYEGLAFQIEQAAADPKISGIVLDIESPGGEAVGAFEIAAVVRQARETKPVIAFVNGMAASAAYAIASGATKIISIPSGIAGSIGVVMMHMDFSEYLKAEGVEPTFIFAGAHKVDGNPMQPLPDEVKERMQAEVNSFYDMFCTNVGLGRPKLGAEGARATEADCLIGQAAVTAGLVDAIGTFEDAIAEATGYSARSPGRMTAQSPKGGSPTMKTVNPGTALATAANEAPQDSTETTETGTATEDPKDKEGETGEAAGAGAAPAGDASASAVAAAVTAANARAVQLTELGVQAVRLGVTFDVAKAIAAGVSPDAARTSILDAAAAKSDAAPISTVRDPDPASGASRKESPIIAAARRTAEAAAAKAAKR